MLVKKVPLLLAFLIPVILFAQSDPAHTDWKTLKHKNCSIQYPSSWNVDESGQAGTSFFLFSPLESEEDTFRENVNLIIQDMKGMNIDLDQYMAISLEQIKTMITNSKLIKSERITKGANTYQKVVYTGEQGAYKLFFEQYYFVIKEKAYVVTYAQEQAKAESYATLGEAILSSFMVK